ncbi:MAG: phosphomannomutase/phosphoglucomutase [Armatimonadetes bacterium]|nr:phosphomannomutase/phosphoglucomutase [Armatimonadota bacterium]
MNFNPQIFREYDIRGKAEEDLNQEFTYNLGKALSAYYKEKNVKEISLGRDCRLSSPILHQNLVQGLLESGMEVLDLGIIPTPLLYYSQFALNLKGGVMITGSHNPPDQNGFKICYDKSTLYGKEIQKIKEIIEKNDFKRETGKLKNQDIIPSYINFLLKNIKPGGKKIKVVLDAGNGTGGITALPIYERLGFDVIPLFIEMDGNFPNHHPDPTIVKNMQALKETVLKEKANLGIALDGDADRIGVIDDQGKIIWGDQLMVVLARNILKENPGATFIMEVKCSQTAFDDIKKNGGNPILWKVGHSLIKAKMKEEHALLGGEMSGHIFFSERYFGYDDSIYAGARLLEILSNQEESLSFILNDLPVTYATPEIRLPCPDEEKFEVVKKITQFYKKKYPVIDIDGARILFKDGWGLVRASNTQAVLVMRFEALSEENLKNIQENVENKLKEIMQITPFTLIGE